MMPLDLSTVQLLALPVLALVAWRISVSGVRVPRPFVLAGVAFALMALWSASTYRKDPRGTFLLTRFANDAYDIESSLFRRKVNLSPGRIQEAAESQRGPALEMYPGTISGASHAQQLFSADSSLRFLVTLKGHWLGLMFRDDDAAGLENPGLARQSGGLRPVRSIALTGISLEPENETIKVLRALMQAQALPAIGEMDSLEAEQRSIALLEGIQVDAFWTSLEHRAYFLWQLGNLRLTEATRDGSFQKSELACALEAYWKAVGYMRTRQRSELLAAIHNNMAVAYHQQLMFDGSPRLAQRVLRSLRRAEAAAAVMQGGHYHTAEIVKGNLEDILRSSGSDGRPASAITTTVEKEDDAERS